MYVARRAFRNYNQMVLPGSVVEPGNTKWFKTRLKDRVIVEVTPHNFKEWREYFSGKFGVTLVDPTAGTVAPAAVKPSKSAPVKAVPVKATVTAKP